MTLVRLPTAPEAEHLAEVLEAGGYQPAEAAAQYRNAFCRDAADIDGCLMFEGPNILNAEAMAHEWAGLDEAGEDEHGSWLNTVFFCALLTLAARSGHPEALATRDSDIEYAHKHWT